MHLIRPNTGLCSTTIPVPPHNFYDDEGIVKRIIGLTKEQVQHITPNQDFAIKVLQQVTPDNNINSIESKVRIRVCTHEIGADYNDVDLLALFTGKTDVFFVIDVGDHLVDRLRSINQAGIAANRLNIHVVHSSITQADSASKTKPNSRVYKDIDNTKSVRVYSWWYNQPITISNADYNGITNPITNKFLSNYNITTRPLDAVAVAAAPADGAPANMRQYWTMQQTWTTQAGSHIYHTDDPHEDNSKPTVLSFLHTHLNNSINTPANIALRILCNLAIQKKRSGDWLQIWYAYILAFLLIQERNHFIGMNTVNRGVGDDRRANYATDIPVDTIANYKSRSYFITGDWPAACYAIYCGINVILIINGSTENKIKPKIICIHCN